MCVCASPRCVHPLPCHTSPPSYQASGWPALPHTLQTCCPAKLQAALLPCSLSSVLPSCLPSIWLPCCAAARPCQPAAHTASILHHTLHLACALLLASPSFLTPYLSTQPCKPSYLAMCPSSLPLPCLCPLPCIAATHTSSACPGVPLPYPAEPPHLCPVAHTPICVSWGDLALPC